MEQIPGPQNGTAKTVLVVDDDAVILSFVSRLLTQSKYNVLSATNGAEALQLSKDYKPDIDLLLSDFQMPTMGGVDLATKLVIERPLLKVLMMSGFPERMLVLNNGWHFLPKPFIPTQLRSLVAYLMS
jgi:two-component system cell cycle sensor histidine kinase/response regulator CckA